MNRNRSDNTTSGSRLLFNIIILISASIRLPEFLGYQGIGKFVIISIVIF